MKTRIYAVSVLLCLFWVAPAIVLAQGKGNGKGGGGNDGGGDGGTAEPVINYELSFVGNPKGAGVLSGRHLIFGCNAFGEVVGRVEDSSGAFKATYYSPITGTVDLTTTNGFQAWPAWTSIAATDINELGQILVLMQEIDSGIYGLFRYDRNDDTLTLLVYDVGRLEARMNNFGDVGFSRGWANGSLTCWYYSESAGTEVEITDQAGNSIATVPRGLNDLGQLVGSTSGEVIQFDVATWSLTKIDDGGAGPNNNFGDIALLAYRNGKYKSKPAIYLAATNSVVELANEGQVQDLNSQSDVLVTGPNEQRPTLYLADGQILRIDTEVFGDPNDVDDWNSFSSFGRCFLSDRDETGFPTIIGKGGSDDRIFILTQVASP